ncbi:MAG: gamma carbonic anhydrase family protein [Acidimicrobiia bacterium]|nr:gamma carbonic anhydrase family protein [Acidimicrobiia bacterium]
MELAVPSIHESAFVARGVRILGDVTVGERAVLMFGVVVRAELDRIEIGAETNVQDNCVLHCDEDIPCLVGKRVTIGHGAVVHGAIVDDHCLVGIGARALNGSHMEEGSWLAAGAVLTEGRTIPPWTIAAGIPAKPLRELTGEERARASDGVDHYIGFGETYRRMGLHEGQ